MKPRVSWLRRAYTLADQSSLPPARTFTYWCECRECGGEHPFLFLHVFRHHSTAIIQICQGCGDASMYHPEASRLVYFPDVEL